MQECNTQDKVLSGNDKVLSGNDKVLSGKERTGKFDLDQSVPFVFAISGNTESKQNQYRINRESKENQTFEEERS